MKPQCNSTCQHACGCLCDRTPGAAVPAGYVIDNSNADEFKVINYRVHGTDGRGLKLDGKCVTVGDAWRPPHDGRVSQIQCDRPHDWLIREMMGQRAMSAEEMRERDLRNSSGMQNAWRPTLDAWHDAQEQEAEDAAWREAVNRGIVRAAAVLVLLVTAAVIYSRMS
jgi:hypothetical protein